MISVEGRKVEYIFFKQDATYVFVDGEIIPIATEDLDGEPLSHKDFVDMYSPNEYEDYLN